MEIKQIAGPSPNPTFGRNLMGCGWALARPAKLRDAQVRPWKSRVLSLDGETDFMSFTILSL